MEEIDLIMMRMRKLNLKIIDSLWYLYSFIYYFTVFFFYRIYINIYH